MIYTMADVPQLAERGATAIVRTDAEPDFAHIYGIGASGTYEPLVDLHLACMRANSFTVRMPDGDTRHICRDCLLDTVSKEGERQPCSSSDKSSSKTTASPSAPSGRTTSPSIPSRSSSSPSKPSTTRRR